MKQKIKQKDLKERIEKSNELIRRRTETNKSYTFQKQFFTELPIWCLNSKFSFLFSFFCFQFQALVFSSIKQFSFLFFSFLFFFLLLQTSSVKYAGRESKKHIFGWRGQTIATNILNKTYLCACRRCPGVMVKAMDCEILVSEFVLQSRYYVHFRTNTLGRQTLAATCR